MLRKLKKILLDAGATNVTVEAGFSSTIIKFSLEGAKGTLEIPVK